MNNKGFAITTILYGTLILFLMLFLSTLGLLSTYKERIEMLIERSNGARDIINNVEEEVIPVDSILADGMVPVTITDDGKVNVISPYDSAWYDYENKKWANAVLVTDANRDYYLDNLSSKVEVDTDDILAYYVWIPRFKYKLWTTTTGSSKQTIEVVFEDMNEPMSTGTTVGSYRTPSSFWWDNNNNSTVDDGELLAGFWAGKFESTVDLTSTCYSSMSTSNCNNKNQSPRILPNVKPVYLQTVAVKFLTASKISASDNIYGLTTTNSDAHLMKNSEWGAITYLAHSQYGINGEVGLNSYSSRKTGCGPTSSGTGTSSSCLKAYGSGISEYPQSTTGNISGIFDMSGGIIEVVMGNYKGTDSSGLFSTFPEKKYYDKYTVSSVSDCTPATCGGHALHETRSWYSDLYTFVSSARTWFVRGGNHNDGEDAGMFYFATVGGSSDYTSWRSAIIVGFGQ